MTNLDQIVTTLSALTHNDLETLLKRTLRALVQLEYRELMNENKELKEKLTEVEEANEEMLEKFSEVQEYIDSVNYWAEDVPSEPDLKDFV